ncbi:MAG: lipid A 3-O-deacylase [Alphaproteobacteria bacterium]|jgi:lipid A 3-O-deacylase
MRDDRKPAGADVTHNKSGQTGRLIACVFAALFFFAATARAGEDARVGDPALFSFSAGAFDINDNDGAGMLSFQYVSERRWIWHFRPTLGSFATFDGGLYAYAGLSLDLYFGKNFVVTPSFAPGLYMRNGGKDLGSPIEFRSSIRAAWRFADKSRLGIDLNHLSNAGIDDTNPGANQLLVFFAIPFSRDGK